MRLLFLGTGGYHPNERRHTAGLLLPEAGIAFDAGSSFFRAPSRLKTTELDIFLTHSHLDHIQGLTFFIVPMLLGAVQKCRVHGDAKTLAAVQEHLFSPSIFPVLPSFEFVPLAERVVINGCTITHCQLKHPGGSVGYQVEQAGRRLAYITDTTADESYLDFIRGADVLIHECYFPDDMAQWSEKTGHSNTSQVTQLARQAAVKRLYLTHIDPQRPDDDPIGLATARSVFPETILAEDLMEIEF